MSTTISTITLPRATLRTLPIVSVRPALHNLSLLNISDSTAKKAVDEKMNAALKNLIRKEIDIDDDALDKRIEAVKIDYRSFLDKTVYDLIQEKIIPDLKKQANLAGIVRLLAARKKDEDAELIRVLLDIDTPLADHPLFVTDVRRSKVGELARISGLPANLLDKIDLTEKPLEYWNDLDWEEAVSSKRISTSQKDKLFFNAEISRVCGENYELVEAAKKAGLTSVAEIVKWTKTEWLDLIKKKKIVLPEGNTAEEFAALVNGNIQETWATEYFGEHISRKAWAQTAPKLLRVLNPLLKNNSDLLDIRDYADIEWKGITAASKKTMIASLDELHAIINTYRHLGIRELLFADKTQTQVVAEIGRRIDLLLRFFQNNLHTDLRLVNLLQPATETRSANSPGGNELKWTGIAAADKTSLTNQLMAYQRVMHLTDEFETAMTLLRFGFDASAAISSKGYTAFAKKSGLPENTAKAVFHKANERASRVAHGIQLKKDAVSGLEQDRFFQGVNPAFVNDLKDIAGYSDLFGSTAYCECEHCRSIFSPAAYFTDLMHFVDTHITQKAFAGKKNHPLRLNMRRPDLWTLPLTCSNTNTLIPQLTLVNEILQHYLKNSLGVSNTISALANDRRAIGLPYHHPLQSIRTYLSEWKTSLADVYQFLGYSSDLQTKELLNLSDEEWNGLIAAGNDISWIKFPTASHTQMDVTDFLRYLAISRNELEELRKTTTAGGFTIEKVSISNDIQSEKEVAKGLSDALLNRIGRFLRLRRSTGFTITELDEIFACTNLFQANKFSIVSLRSLSRFVYLQKQTGLSAEQLIAVMHHVPLRTLKSGADSLAEKSGLIDFAGAGGFPVKFHHAHFNPKKDDGTVDERLPALLSLFGLSDSELLSLFKLYSSHFVFDNKGDTKLDLNNLGLLYAHVTIAKAFRLSNDELSLLLRELFVLPSAVFRTPGQFSSLVKQLQLIRELPFDITELVSLRNGTLNLVSEDQIVLAVADFQKARVREFSFTVLTAIDGVSAPDAALVFDNLIKANLLVKTGDKFALTENYTTATDISAQIPATISSSTGKIHEALLAFYHVNLLPNLLSGITGLSPDAVIAALTLVKSGWENTALLSALVSPINENVAQQPADLLPLTDLCNQVMRAALLIENCGLKTEDVWFISQYPTVNGVADFSKPDFTDVKQLISYRNLVKSNVSEIQNLLWQYQVRKHNNIAIDPVTVFSVSVSKLPVFAKAISTAVLNFTKAAAPDFTSEAVVTSPLNEDEISLYAKSTSRDFTLLRSVFLSQNLPDDAVSGMNRAIELYAFCSQLRIQAHSLSKFQARDFAKTPATEKMLADVLSVKYPDEAQYKKHVSAYTEKLNMQLRDATCDYIIARADLLHFNDREDLYNYFLIDVETSGCFETSRIVAALSSLQQYVSRCLIDLEQSKKDNLAVLSYIDSETIEHEWEWRKNYRVWEANRKVFLYPENYIEPDLRDNKTPLFKELEENLLQRKITIESAEEAYTRYLTGFSEIAQLKIVGAYFDEAGGEADKQIYYFVGRTHKDPFQYYYRRYFVQAKRWEPWQRIDLAIGSPYVSPIVHLGRLYLFWAEVITQEKTGFLDGNSIFMGIEHQVTVQYSHLAENNKWTVAQKKPFTEKFLDRHFLNVTPPFLRNLISGDNGDFLFVTIDKAKSQIMSNAYRKTRTFTKIFVTYDGGDEEYLMIHYFRERLRSNICVKTVTYEMNSKNEPVAIEHYAPIKENQLNNFYIFVPEGTIDFQKPDPAPSYQHFRKKLSLLRNEFTVHYFHENLDATAESDYYKSYGLESVGLLLNNSDPDNEMISLNLRHFGLPEKPATTDAMLVSTEKKGGKILTNAASNKNTHDIFSIGNRQEDVVFQLWKNQHWIHKNDSSAVGPRRVGIRLNTTVAGWLTKILFTQGIDGLLTYETQSTKGEALKLFQSVLTGQFEYEAEHPEELPLKGSHAEYYRELFFHIPFLIANQLNSEGKYREAKDWYEKIFNPTAKPDPNDSNEKHRVWQYIEFRDQNVPKLKEILADKETIHAYESDPFNPHAIARLRMSAYQKSIVMKYVDNLIDWADDLFSKDTMESVTEATMLYVLANEILGKRPVSTGPCSVANEGVLNYNVLGPAIEKGSDFLMYAENLYLQFELESNARKTLPSKIANAPSSRLSSQVRSTGLGNALVNYRAPVRTEHFAAFSVRKKITSLTNHPVDVKVMKPKPEMSLLRQYLPAFCVPPNENLLGYWDRIADRLFKIRNCMNIRGEHRSLALFQPPIDPMLLVRAKAAGLSIDDIVGQLNEALPPYRFSYFIEKARQYLSTVQSFGSALLSALEKKDGESLTLLRAVHEENILAMTRNIKKQHLAESNAALLSLYSSQQNVQNRIDYYTNLLSVGLNGWEELEQTMRHGATLINASVGITQMIAAIAYGVPQIGSPFAMTYGGREIGNLNKTAGLVLKTSADTMNNISTSASIAAHNARRTEEWEQQLKISTEEMKGIQKQIAAAEIRIAIAEKELEIHEKSIEQSKELHDFYKTKFTNYGLYNFMSVQLGRLYREAYQMAAQIARQAERAYQFERDATDFFIQGDNWQSDKSGLLSGERLMLQLQRLEKAYMERNYREFEINQSFSLQQINPSALQELQRNGKCDFNLDEMLFDIYYPGHYRRLIKSVRLTIPSVAGPHTNIAAKLTLNESYVRRVPQSAPSLEMIPVTMTNSIATSQAQNDAGVFDLNFRDERYLPFEGAGAISNWSLSLPSAVRMFNYDSLSDVIVHISYIAKYDGLLEADVEANIAKTLKDYSKNTGLFREFSLRHEFPDTYFQLMNSPVGNPQHSVFAMLPKHFPAFAGSKLLTVSVEIWPKPVNGKTINPASLGIKINNAAPASWDTTGTVNFSIDPVKNNWTIDANMNASDRKDLDDIVILLKYKINQ